MGSSVICDGAIHFGDVIYRYLLVHPFPRLRPRFGQRPIQWWTFPGISLIPLTHFRIDELLDGGIPL
eukprot:s3935_g3.t1